MKKRPPFIILQIYKKNETLENGEETPPFITLQIYKKNEISESDMNGRIHLSIAKILNRKDESPRLCLYTYIIYMLYIYPTAIYIYIYIYIC